MNSPNVIYDDTSIYGGISVSSSDIIRIFCDIERTIKVRRSIVKLEINNQARFYTLDNPDVILKVNGTAVLVRATSLDLTKIYIFNPQTDTFLAIVKETIGIYGDRESMSDKDFAAIGHHANKLQRIESEIQERYNVSIEPEKTEEYFELEIFEKK